MMIVLGRMLIISGLISQCTALLTLQDINGLINTTKSSTKAIYSLSKWIDVNGNSLRGGWTVGEEDPDDVEDTVAAAIHSVDAELLALLNIPLEAAMPLQAKTWLQQVLNYIQSSSDCSKVVQDHHAFLQATTMFLRAVEIKQMYYHWNGESPVYVALAWLQALWASRKVNEQDRSFIEQQLLLYQATECFDKINDQVLRRDVELVEYMNTLMDSFPGAIAFEKEDAPEKEPQTEILSDQNDYEQDL